MKIQKEQFQSLKPKRILKLTKKENPFKVKHFMIGQYVTINDENTVTVAGSQQFLTIFNT